MLIMHDLERLKENKKKGNERASLVERWSIGGIKRAFKGGLRILSFEKRLATRLSIIVYL